METTSKSSAGRRPIAEWEHQSAVMLAWPHANTDWAPRLPQVQECFSNIAYTLAGLGLPLIIVTPRPDDLPDLPRQCTIVKVPTNDTWTRDYGPISVKVGNPSNADETVTLLDFTFNGWGLKFAANFDNLVTQHLAATLTTKPFDGRVENHRDFVLEGGSIEYDGEGTLLTTTSCLCSPNRNARLDMVGIEQQLKQRLGVRKVLWLRHGFLPGDDTDGHIDTLARFAPPATADPSHTKQIVYATAHAGDPHYSEMQQMAQELADMTDVNGKPYSLVALPAPRLPLDSDGLLLPATYANYLVTNGAVLVPTYGQPEVDRQAIDVLAKVFDNRTITGIDCSELIRQHGSLHCSTMQLH